MKRQELLKIMDQELLDKLFGFCYARTSDSQEAQELCSDIVLELVKAANTEGDIENLYGFLWRIAGNTYADFSDKKRRHSEMTYKGDPEDAFRLMASPESRDDSRELLRGVYRQIAFLTKAYREVMILYYLDGLSVAEVARRQNTSVGAIQQRLFSARKKIQSEVEEMAADYDQFGGHRGAADRGHCGLYPVLKKTELYYIWLKKYLPFLQKCATLYTKHHFESGMALRAAYLSNIRFFIRSGKFMLLFNPIHQ